MPSAVFFLIFFCYPLYTGYIEKIQLSATTSANRLQPGSMLRCRVLRKNENANKIFLTNRKEFMADDSLLLRSYDKAVVGLEYHGMVAKIFPDGYLISFCNYVKGMLYKRNLSEADANAAAYFYVGQIRAFRVVFVRDADHITLGLNDFTCHVGTTLDARVTSVAPTGLHITFTSQPQMTAFVPSMFLSSHPSVVPLLQETYKSNEHIAAAVCAGPNVFSLRDVAPIQKCPINKWADIVAGDILSAHVKDVHDQIIELSVLIEDHHSSPVRCHAKMLLEDYNRVTKIDLVAEQHLFVRVLGKNDALKSLTVSAKLHHVWTGDLSESCQLLRQYFDDLKRIQEHCLRMKNPLASLNIGDRCSGKMMKSDGDEQYYFQLANGVQAVVCAENMLRKKPAAKTTVDLLVLWIDYGANVVHCSAAEAILLRHTEHAEKFKKCSSVMVRACRGLKADVMLVLDDLIVVYPRKVTNQFMFIPKRLHLNDFQPIIGTDIRVGDLVNVTAIRHRDDDILIGMFENIVVALKKAAVAGRRREAAALQANVGSSQRVRMELAANNLVEIQLVKEEKNATNDDSDIDDGFYTDTQGNVGGNMNGKKDKPKWIKRKLVTSSTVAPAKMVKN